MAIVLVVFSGWLLFLKRRELKRKREAEHGDGSWPPMPFPIPPHPTPPQPSTPTQTTSEERQIQILEQLASRLEAENESLRRELIRAQELARSPENKPTA